MSVEGFALQSGTYSAEVLRRATIGLGVRRGASIGSVIGGLLAPTDLQLSAGSGMHCAVAAGEAVVAGSSSSTQGGYYFRNTASAELIIAASNPSNPRIETVVAQVHDASYAGGENTFTPTVIEGTATSGATLENLTGVGAVPASSLVLGYVLVPAGASSIVSGDIKNSAERLVPGLSAATYREGTEAERPAAGVKGRLYYATDKLYYSIDNGSEWVILGQSAPSFVNCTTGEHLTGTISVRRELGRAWFKGSLTATAEITGGATLATIPTAYRPSISTDLFALNYELSAIRNLEAGATGVIKSASNIANATVLRFEGFSNYVLL